MSINYKNSLIVCSLLLAASSIKAQITVHAENFGSGIGTWSAVNVSEVANQWTATSGAMQINGASGAADEDWLISPAINMSAQGSEYFLFDYNDANPGNLIELYYSTNYSGAGTSGAVGSATWTNLPLRVINMDNVVCFDLLFQRHPAIDLSAINGTAVYFAFKYTGTAGVGKQYKIDNVRIQAEYYSTVLSAVSAGDRCADLKTTIHQSIRNQTKVAYTSANYDIWDSQLQTDTRMNDAGNAVIVWDMFTDKPAATGEFEFDHCGNRDSGGAGSGEGLFYNREHTFPQSWWGGGQTAADTQYVDLHHIVPSDRLLNIAKSNHPPGIVTAATTTGSNGFKTGTNPSYPCGSVFFEPIDAYKGDYARMYFYLATRYEHNMVAWSSISAEGDCAMSGDPYTAFEPWLLSLLLEWHANDPVSQKEIDRNNAVYSMQGNRNPFIDNPTWANYIWGDNLGNPCNLSVNENELDIKVKLFPNPTLGEVTIELEQAIEKVEVRILNALGQEVGKSIHTNVAAIQLNLNQQAGYYIIELTANEGKSARFKIVKE